MYPNLKAEFARLGLTLGEVAPVLNMSVPTLSLKMNGKYAFTLNEAKSLKKDVLKTDIPLEVLFEEAV